MIISDYLREKGYTPDKVFTYDEMVTILGEFVGLYPRPERSPKRGYGPFDNSITVADDPGNYNLQSFYNEKSRG